MAVLLHDRADVQLKKEERTILFQLAIRRNHSEVVALLPDKGAPVNLSRSDMTPLGMAALKSHPEMVALLPDRGAAVNQANTWHGITPLQLAVGRGHRESWPSC